MKFDLRDGALYVITEGEADRRALVHHYRRRFDDDPVRMAEVILGPDLEYLDNPNHEKRPAFLVAVDLRPDFFEPFISGINLSLRKPVPDNQVDVPWMPSKDEYDLYPTWCARSIHLPLGHGMHVKSARLFDAVNVRVEVYVTAEPWNGMSAVEYADHLAKRQVHDEFGWEYHAGYDHRYHRGHREIVPIGDPDPYLRGKTEFSRRTLPSPCYKELKKHWFYHFLAETWLAEAASEAQRRAAEAHRKYEDANIRPVFRSDWHAGLVYRADGTYMTREEFRDL